MKKRLLSLAPTAVAPPSLGAQRQSQHQWQQHLVSVHRRWRVQISSQWEEEYITYEAADGRYYPHT